MALVFAGPRATGKGTLANEVMGRIFGPTHYALISRLEDVTGAFNEVLAQSALLCFEEALGDSMHRSKSVLKTLFGDKTTRLRKKR